MGAPPPPPPRAGACDCGTPVIAKRTTPLAARRALRSIRLRCSRRICPTESAGWFGRPPAAVALVPSDPAESVDPLTPGVWSPPPDVPPLPPPSALPVPDDDERRPRPVGDDSAPRPRTRRPPAPGCASLVRAGLVPPGDPPKRIISSSSAAAASPPSPPPLLGPATAPPPRPSPRGTGGVPPPPPAAAPPPPPAAAPALLNW